MASLFLQRTEAVLHSEEFRTRIFGPFRIRLNSVYKCTDFYHPNDEGGLAWNDPDIGVEWRSPKARHLSFPIKT